MIEILPIQQLTDEDAPLFGSLNVALGALSRASLPVASGIVVTPPHLKLKATLEHFDFDHKEVFRETLALVEKEINKIPVPEVLIREVMGFNRFLLDRVIIKSVKNLWLSCLDFWLGQIKNRLWNQGFYLGLTDDLDPKVVILVKSLESFGIAYFDPLQDDVLVNAKLGKPNPSHLKKIVDLVQLANKKLFIPHEYEWMLDKDIKLTKLLPYTPNFAQVRNTPVTAASQKWSGKAKQSAVKVFFDLSSGLTIEKDVEGIYIASEKIFDLNKPTESFENLVFKIVESAMTFPNHPILVKLADKREGMGQVRGTLRLLHQTSLLTPLLQALDFARHKKGLTNIHIVIPFVRTTHEFLEIKSELAAKKLMRKNSLQIWMEVAVPENIINLEAYLATGIDGVVLNLDELIAFLNGFDSSQAELAFYKKEVLGLIKFLGEGIKLLHRGKIPFIAYGNLSLYPKILKFLVENGVYGIVMERYEAAGIHDLLYQTEKRIILQAHQYPA